jgi:RNA polymerase sigma-70 factor (ECF subfamily)
VEANSDIVDLAADDPGDTLSARPDSPEDLLLDASLSEDLRRALDRVPEAYREALWLRDVEELSYEDIAEVLAIPIGTVMSRLSRGRRRLHAALTAIRAATNA